MSETLTFGVALGMSVLGLPPADRLRAKGARVAASDTPDHSRVL
jgi:hypothetical protein